MGPLEKTQQESLLEEAGTPPQKKRFKLWDRFAKKAYTPWKFNIAPENIPSQKESSLPTIIFQGLCGV